MGTYAIGDLQGCRAHFEALLETIDFSPGRDRLLLAGDLVNRGPDSLGTLRLVYHYREHLDTVLGNHDLHLLALSQGVGTLRGKDTLEPIFAAEDGPELLAWLRRQPLLVDVAEFDTVVTHAGLPPMWTLEQARQHAREAEATIADDDTFFAHMYGNEPSLWDNALTGHDRVRLIVNYFTRMRFLDGDGRLDLDAKGSLDARPDGRVPWFEHPRRQITDTRIIFGHWAALEGCAPVERVEALDTGCVWGGCLTALRLEDEVVFQVNCSQDAFTRN
jgi:bis(5'-nucleosyl)-tetraphosphatase (symmetrical)